MAEFTGERLIPGQVEVDLLNEHMARYAFAARLARGKRVLDAGCGSGYGSAELAQTARWVVGVDVASEAVEFAAASYQLPNLRFERASCTALPHADGAFDMVVSFEVIEHLDDWRGYLAEVRRVLSPTGQFIVSTPNKLYYTESRGPEGSNPFHVHEFEFEELRSELKAVFPHVSLFFENHVEALAVQPEAPDSAVDARVETARPDPAGAHFFIAVCAHRSQIGSPTFLYVPGSANVLRERERHIALLEGELATKDEWLDKSAREHGNLLELFRSQEQELERSNEWAAAAAREAAERSVRVAEVQTQLERSNQWALSLNGEIAENRAVIAGLQAEQEANQARIAELEAEIRRFNELLEMIRSSRWVRLGRKFRVGPAI